MSEGKLNGHLSTTSLSVVWTTKEVEDKNNNNNNQHHQYSRRLQFFTASFSILSPFLSPSHQLYLWSGDTPAESCLRELAENEIVSKFGDSNIGVPMFRPQDGQEESCLRELFGKKVIFKFDKSKFSAFHMKDGVKILLAPGGTRMGGVDKQATISHYVLGFDVKRIDNIFVQRLGDKSLKTKHDKRKTSLNPEESAFHAEAVIGSQLHHLNIVTPYFIVGDVEAGNMCRPLFRVTPRLGLGSLKEVSDLLLGQSPELREVILSQIIKGALKGLKHIHSKGFVYGNFDPSNIIVCEDQKSLTGLTGKLTGFAGSCKSGPPRSKLGISTHFNIERRKLKHPIIEPPMDLLALGTCLFILCTEPFRDSSLLNSRRLWTDVIVPQMELKAVNDDRRWMKTTSNSLKCLINNLLVRDPNKRFKCGNVLNSVWMQRCEKYFSMNKEEMKKEISEIIKMLKNRVPKDSTINPGTSCDEECPTEFENLETQLSDETSYRSSGSQKSVVCNNSSTSKILKSVTFNEDEIASGQLNNSSSHRLLTSLEVPSRANSNTAVQSKSNFHGSGLSTVATTSDDVSVSKNPLENNSRSPSRTKDELDKIMNEMNNIVRDLDPTAVSTSDAPALNVSASAVNRLSTAISNNLSVSKHEGLTSL